VALAMVLRERCGTRDRVELEMLEGMANHQARAVRDQAGSLLLYAPAVQREDFLSALAYLVRRLDENTAPQNFLHDLFALRHGSEAWMRQQSRFVEGWTMRNSVASDSRRALAKLAPEGSDRFYNQPDSDWTQTSVRTALWTELKKHNGESNPTRKSVLPPL